MWTYTNTYYHTQLKKSEKNYDSFLSLYFSLSISHSLSLPRSLLHQYIFVFRILLNWNKRIRMNSGSTIAVCGRVLPHIWNINYIKFVVWTSFRDLYGSFHVDPLVFSFAPLYRWLSVCVHCVYTEHKLMVWHVDKVALTYLRHNQIHNQR